MNNTSNIEATSEKLTNQLISEELELQSSTKYKKKERTASSLQIERMTKSKTICKWYCE